MSDVPWYAQSVRVCGDLLVEGEIRHVAGSAVASTSAPMRPLVTVGTLRVCGDLVVVTDAEAPIVYEAGVSCDLAPLSTGSLTVSGPIVMVGDGAITAGGAPFSLESAEEAAAAAVAEEIAAAADGPVWRLGNAQKDTDIIVSGTTVHAGYFVDRDAYIATSDMTVNGVLFVDLSDIITEGLFGVNGTATVTGHGQIRAEHLYLGDIEYPLLISGIRDSPESSPLLSQLQLWGLVVGETYQAQLFAFDERVPATIARNMVYSFSATPGTGPESPLLFLGPNPGVNGGARTSAIATFKATAMSVTIYIHRPHVDGQFSAYNLRRLS